MIFNSYSTSHIKEKLDIKETDIRIFDKTTSTNDCLKDIEEDSKVHLALAEEQTKGKGRGGREFFSPKGTGIYMSLSLYLPYETYPYYAITPYAAVAVHKAIEKETGIICGIKWVNDIYYKGKKICGILTEKAGKRLIIGIGINLVRPESGFPESAGNADALFDSDFMDPDIRNRLVIRTVNGLFGLMKGPDESDIRSLNEYYSDRLILKGEKVKYSCGTDGNDLFEAEVEGIDERFRLRVKLDDGTEKYLDSGEIHIITG